MPCLIKPDMHHTWLCIMPCLCLCVYHVVCLFPVLLLSSGNVAIVRIHSTTPVRLLHGLVLLPCGISGKMTATLDLNTIIAMLVDSFYAMLRYLSLVLQAFQNCHEPLTFDTFPMQTVVWLCYRFCSAPLIALLVACEVEDFSMVDRILVGISQYLLYY